MTIVIKRAHVLLGGPYHGAVKMVRDTEQTYLLPGRDEIARRRRYDDVRVYLQTVLYVRVRTQRGDVFVDSSYGPSARALLIRGFENDPNV